MRKISLILLLISIGFSAFSQKDYTVNGESYQLKTEVEGSLNLLWNIIDGNFRYFIENDNAIEELVNTKNTSGSYQEEYIRSLKQFTGNTNINSKSVKLTLPGLRSFINEYNASQDKTYSFSENKLKLNTRLGLFGGITNNPFVENTENLKAPLFGAELEIYDENKAKRHALFAQLTHVVEKTLLNKENEPNDYSATEFSIGYRYRFIYTNTFNMHANLKLVTYNVEFDAPVIFGLGADIKICNASYITLYYNELFALSLDNQGNFSTNLAIGYKFNL
ncbi:MAG: hypothetical protein HKO81_01015 [Flavobacteriaceae bacterium]|nr:hypothetical protein [Bacteroidia bacterium]NNL15204.1 hypothetical protein [Flavobacteriaceae bacterium]